MQRSMLACMNTTVEISNGIANLLLWRGIDSLAKLEFVHTGTVARATLNDVTLARIPAGLSCDLYPYWITARTSIGWGRIRALIPQLVLKRRIFFMWLGLTAERLCAPGRTWAMRDLQVYEASSRPPFGTNA